MKRYPLIPVIIAIILVGLGTWYVNWNKGGEGAGLYSREWSPEAVFGYWDPANFYQSVQTISGEFEGEQCIACHQGVTPGIVNDWRASRHSQVSETVYCSTCHGKDHQALHMPTPDVCGSCHATQLTQFQDERRYGFPSHALAMERALDAKHFVDKPKAEVTSCIQCHSVATKCDSCHTRHRFSAAEARRPEACLTCHGGPPHPDDETYFASRHGQIYLAEGQDWDWSKPLKKGNYQAPTCAYCHMSGGKHQVADKSIWKFGIREINPLSSGNEIKRKQWLDLCGDCHETEWARARLTGLDQERKRAWQKLYAAEDILKDLRGDDLLYPAAGERPPYPNDWLDRFIPYERIGFYEGQASALYNVSAIERDYFEMWYFANLAAYKGAAHGDINRVTKGHAAMDRALTSIQNKAAGLRQLGQAEEAAAIKRIDPSALWLNGEYTEHNREHN